MINWSACHLLYLSYRALYLLPACADVCAYAVSTTNLCSASTAAAIRSLRIARRLHYGTGGRIYDRLSGRSCMHYWIFGITANRVASCYASMGVGSNARGGADTRCRSRRAALCTDDAPARFWHFISTQLCGRHPIDAPHTTRTHYSYSGFLKLCLRAGASAFACRKPPVAPYAHSLFAEANN